MAVISEKANFLSFMEVVLPFVSARMIDGTKTFDQRLSACYYDPARYAVKLKKAGLITASKCDAILANFKTTFRNTYLPSAGYFPSIPFYYTTGLAEDYLENGDTVSKSAIASMVANSGYTRAGANQSMFNDIHYARELAFSLCAYINNYRVGNTTVLDARATTLKGYAITLLQKWQSGTGNSTQFYIRPFMVALVTDALILWDNTFGLSAAEKNEIRNCWQHIHTTMWRSGDTHPSLKFTSVNLANMDPNVPNTTEQQDLVDQNQAPENQDGPGTDLSLLICPVYAWLYKKGYDGTTWQTRADEMFKHGFPHYVFDTGYGGEGDYYQAYGAYIGTVGPNGIIGKHVNQQLFAFAEFVADFESAVGSTYNISGTVTVGGSPLAGVLITASGGLSGTQTTDASGNYSFTGVANGTSYTLTPTKTGYTFSPTTETGTVVGANVTGENFAATAITYSISGTVTHGGSPLAGVLVTATGGLSGTRTTDASGNYSFTGVANGTSYTLTPTKTGYTFSPTTETGTIASANITGENFTATAVVSTYSISGTVTVGGSPLSGVLITATGGLSGTQTTDGSGNYSFTGVVNGTGYTLTPTKTGYTFSPTTETGTVTGANITGENFAATANTYSISGTVTVGGSPLAGVLITATGGLSSTQTTDGSGNYSFTGVANGVSYTLTPTKSGYTFAPTTETGTISNANITGENFAATVDPTPVEPGAPSSSGIISPFGYYQGGTVAPTYSISGTVTLGGSPLAGVLITASGGLSGTQTTDASGNYSFIGIANGTSYTLTPTKTGYTFSPTTETGTISAANITGENFAATAVTYSISGTVTVGGSPLSGVLITATGGLSGTQTTDGSGNYSFTGVADGTSYTLTPTKAAYTFAPTTETGTVTGANVTGENFAATAITYSISGTVTIGGSPLAGVLITASGGLSGTQTTDASGNYSFTGVANGTSYTLTPTKTNYTFSPTTETGTISAANITGENFVGTANPSYNVSGAVTVGGSPLSGVTLTASGGFSGFETTVGSGTYTFPPTFNGTNYTITPSKVGYTFSPASRNVTIAGAHITAQDFAATAVYSISGVITSGGSPVAGVLVTATGGLSGTQTTNASGFYSFTGVADGTSYTLTPTKTGYTFAPTTETGTIAGANITGEDFVGTSSAYNPANHVTGGTVRFWFDFSDAAKVLDSGGAAASSGENVATVNPTTGTPTLSQSTDGSRPTMILNVSNSLQGVRFPGNKVMNVTSARGLLNNQNKVLMGAVFKLNGTAGNGQFFNCVDQGWNTNRFKPGLAVDDPAMDGARTSAPANVVAAGANLAVGSVHAVLYLWDVAAATATIYADNAVTAVNGSAFSTAGSIENADSHASAPVTLGTSLNADMLDEFLIVGALPTGPEITAWFAAVKAKFGITVY